MVAAKWGRDALSRRWRLRLIARPGLKTDLKIIAFVGICTAVATGIVVISPMPASGWKVAANPAPAFKGLFKRVRPSPEPFEDVKPALVVLDGAGPPFDKLNDVVLVPDDLKVGLETGPGNHCPTTVLFTNQLRLLVDLTSF